MDPEILIEDNRIKLARILNKFDNPIAKYPKFGVWTYLLDSEDGIIVFDPGPRYKVFSIRKKETYNAERTIEAVEHLFPQKPITQILFSHYHVDHAEAAPHLQYLALKKFGLLPS
ncbi:MBL fold metallo-hydrolase [Candidatus Dojkabacteria bacterium]|nr:MBL fold metallo-hydrolase [Candidatus Dojkabacteria bacterium]